MVNEGYELFVKRCAKGRGMTTDEIKKIAEGRVWTGTKAKELGLVDELGGLDKALEIAIEKAGLDAYTVMSYGENLDEREAGKHFDVVKAQIEEVVYNLTEEQYKNLVIAYEPVWAIGTGKTASAEQAQEIHAYIRQVLAAKFGAAAQETAILYGGSCKPSNAAEIFAKEDVDGGLIGGAALKAEDFLAIGKGFSK